MILGIYVQSEDVAKLAQQLMAGDLSVRAELAKAGPRAIPYLEDALLSRKSDVATTGMQILMDIGPPSAPAIARYVSRTEDTYFFSFMLRARPEKLVSAVFDEVVKEKNGRLLGSRILTVINKRGPIPPPPTFSESFMTKAGNYLVGEMVSGSFMREEVGLFGVSFYPNHTIGPIDRLALRGTKHQRLQAIRALSTIVSKRSEATLNKLTRDTDKGIRLASKRALVVLANLRRGIGIAP